MAAARPLWHVGRAVDLALALPELLITGLMTQG